MVVYTPGFTGGDVTVPPSKSAAQRIVLCAALSGGKCTVSGLDRSKDIEAVLNAVRGLGAATEYDPEKRTLKIDAAGVGSVSCGEIDCVESGNTLRFLTPIAAALGGEWRLVGHGRLPQRPMGVYRDLLPAHGVTYRRAGEDELPLELSGKLTAGVFSLPGNISSQFITGLLLALPLIEGDSEIVLTTPLESAGYVDLTLSILRDFGVTVSKTENGWHVPGGQRYVPCDRTVEGDWSQAAFFLAMAAVDPGGAPIRLHGLKQNSAQGDKACVERFGEFGLASRWDGDVLTVWNPAAAEPFGGLHGCTVDVSQITDMAPALSVCAALSRGETRIIGAGRLRLKESDRLSAMEDAINALGGCAKAEDDRLIIQGVPVLSGGTAEGRNDHRVVMALAAAGLRCSGEVHVTDEFSINKTYPNFFDDFRKLGGNANVVHLGGTD